MEIYENIRHEFAPVFDENSRVLILGTFPSVKSGNSNFIMDILKTASGR